MTLSEIHAKLVAKLEEEAGSSDWWTSTELKQWVNDLYRETAEELQVCKARDTDEVTVAEQVSYTLPVPTGYERIIALLGVTYDKIKIDPISVDTLDNTIYRWRNQDSGIPREYYYELGEDLVSISLFPKPATADVELGFDLILLPDEMENDSSPAEPFTNGFLLINGVLAIALAKAGGGRDLDRSEHYWLQYITGLQKFAKSKHPRKITQLGSIESVSMVGNVRLGDHYPPYRF